jgi:hypothetical protein
MSQLHELEGETDNGQNRPTEFEKGVGKITDKMFNPQNLHDRQILTNIPKQILTNLMMMDGIEEGLRKLIYADDIKVDENMITLFRKININERYSKTNRFIYKKMTYQSYRRAIFYADAMQGFSGNLLELLMSVDGWRSNQGENMTGSLANTEQQKIGANQEQGWLKRQISKLV